jgi:hypothetical protein
MAGDFRGQPLGAGRAQRAASLGQGQEDVIRRMSGIHGRQGALLKQAA